MNRTNLFRALSLCLGALTISTASLAGPMESEQLAQARRFASEDAQVAVSLQAWIQARDAALNLAQGDAVLFNELGVGSAVAMQARDIEVAALGAAILFSEMGISPVRDSAPQFALAKTR